MGGFVRALSFALAACGGEALSVPIDASREEASEDDTYRPADAAIVDAPAPMDAGPLPCPRPKCDVRVCQFDRGAAATSLGAVDLTGCHEPNGPSGSGHVKVTYVSDGTVSNADVDAPPFAGTSTGACIAALYRAVCIPAFTGDPVTVGKSFSLP